MDEALYLALDQGGDGGAVGGVQGLVDLVKEVERGRVTALDGEDEGEGHQCLLSSRELLHEVAVARAGEGDLWGWVNGWVGG